MSQGYIKLHRQLVNCPIWDREPFTWGQAWIDLLLRANHKDKTIIFDSKPLEVKKGQVVTSILKLSTSWKWDRKKTVRFLRFLESEKMATTNSTRRGTTITIVNWELYQCNGTTNGTTDGTTSGQQVDINNNDKNVNKSKKYIYSARFEEFWELYAKKTDKGRAYACYNARLKEGYTEDEIIEACKAYMDECKRTKREKIYIKDPKTFLSVHKPFVEYIPKKDKDTGLKMEDGALVFNLDYGDETPPYYGLPKEWYNGEELVRERMTPIKQPATPKMGLYNDKIYSVKEVYETYKVRRDYFDRQGNS